MVIAAQFQTSESNGASHLGHPSASTNATAQPERDAAWEDCKELASDPALLDKFAADIEACGLSGETRNAKILYLALTSRWLPRPVSIVVKGPSSGGKSFLVKQTLRFFPESAYYELSAMSEKVLAYSTEPVSHRFIVVYEAAGMAGETATYLMRSLISEGRIRYETAEATKDGVHARLINREGPTGLVTTTTRISLHPENETRMLSLTIADTQEQTRSVFLALAASENTQEQTRSVFLALAASENREAPDLNKWLSLQKWLEYADHNVIIPFAKPLASIVPTTAMRLRRDFQKVLDLIRVHTILHQAQRARDGKNRIVATVDDYSAVRELIEELLAEGVHASVPDTVRETVEAVRKLSRKDLNELTELEIANELQLDKSTTSRRIRDASTRGFLENLQDRKGRPARIVLTDQVLPDNQGILPTVDELLNAMTGNVADVDSNANNGCTIADEIGDTVSTSACAVYSGIVAQAGTLTPGTVDQA
jgi:hypothetical protein